MILQMRLTQCFFGLVFFAFVAQGQLLNDGTTTNNLVKLSSQVIGGDAQAHLQVSGNTLRASQTGGGQFPFVPLKTVWYSTTILGGTTTYSAAADFLPEAANSLNRGGVLGWLNSTSQLGIALEVVPGETLNFRLSSVDFSPGGSTNALTNLYNLNGTPATESSGSAWAGSTNYIHTNFATFNLEFAPPTASDLVALSNATARVIGKVIQGTNQLASITNLTDLPVPGDLRIGYFGYWTSEFTEGFIGNFDNLILTLPTGNSPTMAIVLNGSNVILSWPSQFSSWRLETSPNITNSVWSRTSPGTNQVTLPATNRMEFFRLSRP